MRIVTPAITCFALLASSCGSEPPVASSAATPTATRAAPSPSPSPSLSHAYPPLTIDDVRALASEGDSTQVHGQKQESVGLAACPAVKVYATVLPELQGRPLLADLLSAFYFRHLDSECGGQLVAYFDQDLTLQHFAGVVNLSVYRDQKPSHLLSGGARPPGNSFQVSY